MLALTLGGVLTLPLRFAIAEEATHPVPRASCGPHDRIETVQGQITLAERFRPGPSKAYNCNLELIGQFAGEGSAYSMRVIEDCAYVSTWQNPQMKRSGVLVLDVSNASNPKLARYLDTPAMLAVNESLEVHQARKLLIANKLASTTFDIYDLSTDCRHPVLKSSTSIPRVQSHAGTFTTDGRTFYGASCCDAAAGFAIAPGPTAPPTSAVFAIDVTDPSHPSHIATWIPHDKEWITHSVNLNKDGTRAFVGLVRMDDDHAKAPNPNGLVILDVSDVNARRTQPQFRVISTLFWNDTHTAQYALPVTIAGRSYLVWTDLSGAVGWQRNPPPADACDSGKPGYGFARIIDISDEKHPKTVSKLMLEVQDPANCRKAMHDPTVGWLQYGSAACDVDDDTNARLLACGYVEGGLRVFDILDPAHPKEVAYYKPPARRTESRPGSPSFGLAKDHTADQVIYPKFHDQGTEIWFNSFDNGFQVVRFTDHFKALRKDLFTRP